MHSPEMFLSHRLFGWLRKGFVLALAIIILPTRVSSQSAGSTSQSPVVAKAEAASDSSSRPPAEALKPRVTRFSAQVPKVSRPPELEDFLNDRPREDEAVVADFRQRDPGDGIPVSEPTTVYLSYDAKNLYVVFACKDEPSQVRAHMAKREAITEDDVVSVYIDSFHDGQRAYVFQTNPLGVQRDGIVTEGQKDDFSFDTLWYSGGRLTPEGFIVWMAISFSSLRFSNAAEQTWGIALGRRSVRKNEKSFWPYITRRVEGFVPQMARLDGLAEISPGRNMQFIPYGIFTRARFLDFSVLQIRMENNAPLRAGLQDCFP